MLLLPSVAAADVKLVVRADGSKVIVNSGVVPGGPLKTDFDWLARQHNRATIYDELIERHSRDFGVDPILVKAVIQVESNFNPAARSHKGARGLMQLMPPTARRFGVASIHDPDDNIRGGVAYLAFLQRLFDGDLTRILAGYNAGENAVIRYGGIPPYAETQLYVRKALTVYHGRPSGGISIASRSRGESLGGGFRQKTAPAAAASSPAAIIGSPRLLGR
jgi:soluble lytic murein transglycosylase-like protein